MLSKQFGYQHEFYVTCWEEKIILNQISNAINITFFSVRMELSYDVILLFDLFEYV